MCNRTKFALIISIGSLCCICMIPIYWLVKAGGEWIVPSGWIVAALGIPLTLIPSHIGLGGNFYVHFLFCILQYQIIALLIWKWRKKGKQGL